MHAIKQSILADALETIDEAVAIYDPDDRLIAFNHKYEMLRSAIGGKVSLGTRWTELVAASVYTGGIPEAVDREEEWLQNRRRARGSYSVRRQIPDGRWFQVNERRMCDGGVAVVWTDISALVNAEEQLRNSLTDAKMADTARTDNLRNIAHELRSPLTSILAFAEMITHQVLGPVNPPRYAEYAENITGSAEHLLSLTNSLLDIARMESRSDQLDEDICNVQSLLDAVIRVVAPQVKQKNIDFKYNNQAICVRVVVDELRMRQVLINLISNAVKFTPNSGKIDVNVNIDPEGGLRIQVHDTGIGIESEDIPKIMLPFGRLAVSRTRHIPGAGLGLPLSKAIVEAHGGQLTLESAVGTGTTASVLLPHRRVLQRLPA